MKKNILFFTYLIGLLTAISCKENTDLYTYDESKSSIYFDYKFGSVNGQINTTKGVDSIDFSFTTIGLDQDKYVVKIPVKISGQSRDYDRNFEYKVIDTLTNLDARYYKVIRHTIQKNKFIDTLEVEVSKYIDLQTATKNLVVELRPNENFEIGYFNNQKIKIKVSNMLTRPNWWNTWQGVFGTYSQEKYQMWIQIYHEKADGYLDYRYSYKNMPTIANKSFYPSTFAFIAQLKDYFEKNVVHEGGDPTKPRVTIPFQF